MSSTTLDHHWGDEPVEDHIEDEYRDIPDDEPVSGEPSNVLLDLALAYAEQGYRVFPVDGEGRPLPMDYISVATKDPAKIERWWQGPWPTALPALLCCEESDMWALKTHSGMTEIDGQRRPYDGYGALVQIMAGEGNGPLPRTMQVKDHKFSRYFMFRWPETGSVRSAKGADGVKAEAFPDELPFGMEILGGDGGFVVAPGAYDSLGRSWDLATDAPKAPCAPWFMEGVAAAADAALVAAVADDIEVVVHDAPPAAPSSPRILSPFVTRLLPARRYFYGDGYYMEGTISSTIGDTTIGKSTMTATEAVDMATGRGLLGYGEQDPVKVLLFHLEDDAVETERKVQAAMAFHGLKDADLGGNLVVKSLRDCRIQFVENGQVDKRGLEEFRQIVGDNGFQVWDLEPVVKIFKGNENDARLGDDFAAALTEVAVSTKSAGGVKSHPRKGMTGQQREITWDDNRGSGAFVAACRSKRTVNVLGDKDKVALGLPAKDPAEGYIRLFNKANTRAGSQTVYLQFASQDIANADGGVDSVGVVTRVYPKERMETAKATVVVDGKVSYAKFYDSIVEALKSGEGSSPIHPGLWRKDFKSKEPWIGEPVATVVGLVQENPEHRKELVGIVDEMLCTGRLVQIEKKPRNGRAVQYVGVPSQEHGKNV